MSHSYVDATGLRVHVAEAGSGDPLLLLHGWPQHWYAFHRIIPQLAERFRVICPDMRGFGWSEAPPGGYEKEQLARDVVAVLDALDLDDAHVAGHDWGGMVAYLLALQHAPRVRRLVVLNSGQPWPSAGMAAIANAWRILPYQSLIATPLLGRAFVRRAMVPAAALAMRRRDVWSEQAASSYREQFGEPERVAASVALYRTFLVHELPRWAAGHYDGRRVGVPTLVIHGAGDPVLRPSMLRGLEQHVDDLQVELLDGIGHFVAEEAPTDTARHMLQFLE